ncbi:MAG: serine/threonine-protein kinase [Leptolyngbyaceae cyanobacterium MO_188.B28]|nr:serine/threonine-protein kinase [Leptolyngbyaceae cyanobacterium MO_188.B28]
MTETIGDRYEIQKELGRQTGRRTVLALDRQTDRQVVIKQLWLGEDFDWKDLKLFEREADVLKALSHPNIPEYLDYLELTSDNGPSFALAQSHINCRSLEAQLTAGRTFSESDVKVLAKSLLEILIYLHGLSPPVIHRDIKPSNILLSDRSGNSPGDVYLVDFGSVQTLAAQEGGTITVVGTYGYMPPEQFGGRVVPASDLYSLGAALIFLATGQHPSELPQKKLQLQFRQRAGLSPRFADWLEWMTEPSLSKRFASAQASLDALDDPPRRPAEMAKPANSQIRLSQTSESLTLLARRNDSGFLGITALTIVGLILGWLMLGSICGFGAVLPINPFGAVLGGLLFAALGLPILRQQRLEITPRQITLFGIVAGIRWRQAQASRSVVDRIVLQRAQQRTIHDQLIRTPAKLTILAGRDAFPLEEGLFTPDDLYWLAEELSRWLNLPLTIEEAP